jgi:hypothetical protein
LGINISIPTKGTIEKRSDLINQQVEELDAKAKVVFE